MTSRRAAAALVAGTMAFAGVAVPLFLSSSADAATVAVGPYQATADVTTGLVSGQVVNLTVTQPAGSSTLQSIEIHLCNVSGIVDQFTYGFTADGACTNQPPAPGVFSDLALGFVNYAVPPGELTSTFTYKVGVGPSADGKVTPANTFLVYRVTNSLAEEWYGDEQLTFGSGPPPTTTTTVPETTTTTVPESTTTTTVPESTTTTTVPESTTTTTVPESTTTTTVPGSTTTTTVPGSTTTTTVPESTTTTVPESTTTTTVPESTTTTTVPESTTTTTMPGSTTTSTTTMPSTTTTHATTTTTKPATTTTRPAPDHGHFRAFLEFLRRLLWLLFHIR